LQGLAEPTLKSMMSRRVSEAQQGRLQGAIQSVASLAGIAGPIFFGWVYAVSSLTLPGLSFLIAASVLVLAALFSAGSKVNAGNTINETSV
jgi:DHA1 family tetracycline resistance protein-like MFS transporter